ncbi:hypothetical protein [Hymenobacter bucti]|uniref:DUF3298 domain-containing protein n=1 Tax=Hymenobacter bucti TaxID=1844114 RepID=A0ABW4R2C7_9BACT
MSSKFCKNHLVPLAGRVIAGLLALSGCQPNTTPKAEVATAQKRVAALPARPVAAVVAAPSFVGYHRYRGTVGTQPVILELLVDASQNFGSKGLRCEGKYFYERRTGGDLVLKAPAPYRPGQPLHLLEDPTGTWQATQPLGPVLSGTWTSRAGRRLPFALREDYQDAVRYETLTHAARGPACSPEYREYAAWRPFAELTQEFLHLLGPDTLRPALRRLQCPPPARRRARTRAAARQLDCADAARSIGQSFNAYGLLAIKEGEYVNEYNGSRPHAEDRARLYDLRAGRWLTLAELLRPEADSLRLLEQLVSRHLVNNQDTNLEAQGRPDFYWQPGDSTIVALPRSGVGFTSQGLVLLYEPGEVSYGPAGPVEVYLSYPELLPLLRPASPVARMLRERGLWRDGQKQ